MRQGPTTLSKEKRAAVMADADGSIRMGRYVFKRASEPAELDQLHRLNYETFVREVAQHADNGVGLLVDKFHDKNVYFVALQDDRVVGMISMHDTAPFSIADKLPDPAILARLGPRPRQRLRGWQRPLLGSR